MRTYIRVIVKKTSPKQWSASFADVPEIATGGKFPSQAIARLFLLVGDDTVNVDELTEITDAARDGHLEFRIRLLNHWTIPVPSMN